MRVLASFGYDGFITGKKIGMARYEKMRAKKVPQQRRSGNDRDKDALDRTILGTVSGPARIAQHRHATRHRQHRQDASTEVAEGGQ